MLDVHADPDYHRAVFSLAGRAGVLAEAVAAAGLEPEVLAASGVETPRATLDDALPALRVGDAVHVGEAAISATLAAVRWGRAAGA